MAVGTLKLHRFNSDEEYALKSAMVRVLNDSAGDWFSLISKRIKTD